MQNAAGLKVCKVQKKTYFSFLNHIFLYGGRQDCAKGLDRKAKNISPIIPARFQHE